MQNLNAERKSVVIKRSLQLNDYEFKFSFYDQNILQIIPITSKIQIPKTYLKTVVLIFLKIYLAENLKIKNL